MDLDTYPGIPLIQLSISKTPEKINNMLRSFLKRKGIIDYQFQLV